MLSSEPKVNQLSVGSVRIQRTSMDSAFECSLCLEVAKNAVETDCCGHIFCELCVQRLQKKTCPQCRHDKLSFRPNKTVRRAIERTPAPCPNKCEEKISLADLKSHLEWCAEKVYRCPVGECQFSGKRGEFCHHIADVHPRELVTTFRLSGDREDKGGSPFDPVDPVMNGCGRRVRLSKNGKYYCGARMICRVRDRRSTSDIENHEVGKCRCECCRSEPFICGPESGCNCDACQRLDIQVRNLPAGWLVSVTGRLTKYTKDSFEAGHFRFGCGMQTGKNVSCGGNGGSGADCSDCKILRQHVSMGLYQDIIRSWVADPPPKKVSQQGPENRARTASIN